MTLSFAAIPEEVIAYVRDVFGRANDKVSATLCAHPSIHEEMLDSALIAELSVAAPAFFSDKRIGVAIESHWLGGRHMYERWEIADIAFFITIRSVGQLVARKVALLQMKRLYSNEMPVLELDHIDYEIGIGRIVDRIEPIVSLSTQRQFSFDANSVYGALRAKHSQVERIDRYVAERQMPVFYGLYNPSTLPLTAIYPPLNGPVTAPANDVGCRIITSEKVHAALGHLDDYAALAVKDLVGPDAPASTMGWRLENFIADEVLRCRQGRLFADAQDPNLSYLLYRRSAPITAAVNITIDFGSDAG